MLRARRGGVVAVVTVAARAFRRLAREMRCEIVRPDGSRVLPGDVVMRIAGPGRAMRSAERTALNCLCRLSGSATATAELVEAAKGTKARITCHRNATPGLQAQLGELSGFAGASVAADDDDLMFTHCVDNRLRGLGNRKLWRHLRLRNRRAASLIKRFAAAQRLLELLPARSPCLGSLARL